MSNVTPPYSDVGKASFEQLDTYLQSFVIAGDQPELASYPFKVEENQALARFTVVGLNSRNRLVPATITETAHIVVTGATVAAGGASGANGAAVVTGTTGTGTKFQANVTIAGGAITAVNSIAVEGDYSVGPTTPAAEPVTGASLVGAELSVTTETIYTKSNGVAPVGVLTEAITTTAFDDQTAVPVWYSGCFNIRALVWDASYAHDEDKFNAFIGAPTPTTVTIKKRQSDL